MRKYLGVTVFLGLIIIGFIFGTNVGASSSAVEPGSTGDPLVTKSYVDNAVNQKAADLQKQIDDLKQQLNLQ